MKQIFKISLLFIIFTLFSCTTQKSRSDVSGLSKFFHNVNAEYNGYFNANVLLQESIANLNKQHQDNYNKILPVYKYVAAENPKAVAGDLDKAIEKVSIVISIHRVSDWTDDCYLLLGQAQYVKQDYESAEETFQFFEAEFNSEALAKKKAAAAKKKSSKSKKVKKNRSNLKKELKKKRKQALKEKKAKRKRAASNKKKGKKSATPNEKPEAEQPKKIKKAKKEEDENDEPKPDDKESKKSAYHDGLLWYARTYTERDKYEKAHALFTQLENDLTTPQDVRNELPAARAHFYLKRKQYANAIAPLEQAIEITKKKADKARYSYILAQILLKQGHEDRAIAHFKKVIKNSRDYEMQFSAKMELEKNAWKRGGGSFDDVVNRLEKMAKDIRNYEYRDYIYYTLAEISLENDKEKLATQYYKQSLANSLKNVSLKVESYYQLANLYFNDNEFIQAKNYFDSTLMVLPKTDERYDLVNRFSNNLTDIAKNLEIIQEQDSLLAIAQLSEAEKLELAYKIKKEQDQARLDALKAGATKPDDKFKSNNRIQSAGPGASGSPSTFFAYNDKTLKRGQRDFEKTWGTRKLEDDWRRSNKRDQGDLDEVAEIQQNAARELTDEDVSTILKNIPSTDDEIQAAKDKIIDAMFTLGSLYRDRLQMNDLAIEMLETLDRRFPGNKHELDSWYFLYLAYSETGQPSKAKIYYDKIVGKYPETTYANILQDPNFLENSKEAERRLTRYYNETYAEFTSGKYETASQRAVKAVEMFGQANTLQPKFALLYAMCMGNLQGVDAYKKELQDLIAKYPNTPEQLQAKEILRILGGRAVTADDKDKIGGETLEEETDEFKLDDDKLHYFIVVLLNNTIQLNDAKTAVSDFNRQFYKLEKLRISNVYLGTDTDTPILVIRRFDTKTHSMEYYDTILKNTEAFLPKGTAFEMFAVTQYNYRQILKTRTLDNYRTFFDQNYK